MSVSFGEILRETRQRKNLSQSELAEKTGLQASAISHFESGRRMPSFENMIRLADALTVTLDFLMGRTEQPETAGPTSDQLFRYFKQLSNEDQEMLSTFAQFLVEKKIHRPMDK
jgi:transcriptional regulator with XRE-family HTH domain